MASVDDSNSNTEGNNEMLMRLSEAILTNLMVLDTIGIPRDNVKQLIASDGVSLIGGGMELQIPISPKLTKEVGQRLFKIYSKLLEEYDAGHIQPERIRLIRERNGFDHKVAAAKQSKSRLN